jgi:hypothetical protein
MEFALMPDVTVQFGGDISGLTDAVKGSIAQLDNFTQAVEKASSRSAYSLEAVEQQIKNATEQASVFAMVQGRITGAAFAETALGAAALTGAVVIATIEMAKLTMRSAEVDEKLNAVAHRMAEVGNVGLISIQQTAAGYVNVGKVIQDYITQLQTIPGVTQQDAAAMQAIIGSANNYSSALNSGIVDYITHTAKSREEAQNLAKVLTRVFSDPINQGRAFIETLGGATTAEVAQFEAAQRGGNVNQANAAIYDILISRLRAVAVESQRTTREAQQSAEWLGRLNSEFNEAGEQTARTLSQQTEQIEKNFAAWKQRADAIRNQPQTPAQMLAAGREAGEKQSSPELARGPLEEQIKAISGAMEVLRTEMRQGVAAPDAAADLQKFGDQLEAARRKVQQLDDQIAGGSAYERRNSEIQQTALLSHQSAVDTLTQQVASDRQRLDSEVHTDAERRAALTSLAQHTFDLEREKAAVTAAQANLRAQAEVRGSAAELAAKRAATAATKAIYGERSAEALNIERQELADRQALEKVDAAIAREAETGRYNIALAELSRRETIVREEAQTSRITHSEELASLLELNAQRETVQKRYFAFLAASYGDDRQQHATYMRQLEEVDSQSAARRAEINRQVAKEIDADFKRSFEGVGSSAGSAITGMITREQTLRQATQSVATSMLSSFVQAQTKRAADFAAGIATEVAMHLAGESAKTAGTVAGETARTGAKEAGAVTDMATVFAGVLKSVSASAIETFAGVFGFLSPVMGPAAAGPAAAAEGVVMAAGSALPSFDVGAWRVNRTGLAVVHQNEFIPPAGASDFARAAFASALGGQSGVAPNITVNFTHNGGGDLTPAKIRQHGRTIAEEIARQWDGPGRSKRPKY